MHTTNPSNSRKARSRHAGKSFSEKKSPQVPQPPSRPKIIETLALKSGETRRVEIEATNDPAWAKFSALVEAATGLSLDGKGVEHQTMQAIVEMRADCEARGEKARAYWLSHGMKVPKEAKSPFQPPVMYLLTRLKERSGQNHTAKASKMAGAMDEFWEFERLGIDGETVGQIIDGVPFGRTDAETGAVVEPAKIEPIPPDRFAEWLEEKYAGYSRLYKRRTDRGKEEPADQSERYDRFLKLPPRDMRPIPDWLKAGYDGEVVIAARINRTTGVVEDRAVWRPDDRRFWYGSSLDHFIKSRPEFGDAVRPIEHVERLDDAGLDGHEIGRPVVARSPAEAETEVTDETPVEEGRRPDFPEVGLRSELELAAHPLQPIVEPGEGNAIGDGRAALEPADGDSDETSVVTEAAETTIDEVDATRRRRIERPKPTREENRQAFDKLVRQTRQIEIPTPEEITLAGAQGFLNATIFVNPETGMTSIISLGEPLSQTWLTKNAGRLVDENVALWLKIFQARRAAHEPTPLPEVINLPDMRRDKDTPVAA